MKRATLFAIFLCLSSEGAYSQSNAVDAIIGNFATARVRPQSAKDVHPGYFNLKIGDNSCSRTDYLIQQAERQTRSLCPIRFLPCPVEGSYSVSSAVEVAFRGLGGAPVKSKTALFVAGSELQGRAEPLECGRALASSVRANEPIEIGIEAAGSLERVDPQKLAVFLARAAQLAGVAVSIARPTLGGQIVSGERPVEIARQTKPLSEWLRDIETRGRAVSELLKAIAESKGDRVKKRPVVRMTPRDDGLNIEFDDKSQFELRKDYFWTIALPRWSPAQDSFRFDPEDLRSGSIDSNLKEHIGLDVDGLARSIDVNFEMNMRSQDPAMVAQACKDLVRKMTPLMRRQDALAITWHIAYKFQPQNSAARCFGEPEVAELFAFGLTAPPYAAAYGPSRVSERQP